MQKEFEINGYVTVPPEVTEDEFYEALFSFFESKGWYYGGGINEVRAGRYVIPDGSFGKNAMREEYDITNLNPRKNPYTKDMQGSSADQQKQRQE